MSDPEAPTDWRELHEFVAADLSQSFILSWYVESEFLMIDVDVFLTAEHPFYEKPRPAEKICIRPAIIEFPYCKEISIAGVVFDTISAAVESLGHGAITGLLRLAGGRYEISGDFGTVMIRAERPLLRLKGR